jgi:hypothetical protein
LEEIRATYARGAGSNRNEVSFRMLIADFILLLEIEQMEVAHALRNNG